MFHITIFAIWAFLAWRFVWPLPLSRAVKVTIGGVLLVLTQHHLVTRLISGNMFSPEVPFGVIAALAWLFFAAMLLAVLIGARDLVIASLRAGGITLHKRQHTTASCTLAVAALLLSAVAVYQAALVPKVNRVDVVIRGLPPGLDGLRIVQLSDLHISRFLQADWTRSVVDTTNALAPDLIVVTGDIIDGTVKAREADVAPLASLHAVHGVIAIPGNHEYYFNEPAWSAALGRLGMRVLVNQHIEIGPRGAGLTIAGVTDAAALAYGLPGPDLKAALRDVPAGAPIILLSHRPADAVIHAGSGIALQLSGHTHGGMVLGMDVIVAMANQGYVSGLYDVSGMSLYVSNGTGIWNGFPVRLGVPAEITEFVLHAQSSS